MKFLDEEVVRDDIREKMLRWRVRGCLTALVVTLWYFILPQGTTRNWFVFAILVGESAAFVAILLTGGGYGIRGAKFEIKPYPHAGGFATGALFAGCIAAISVLLMTFLSRK